MRSFFTFIAAALLSLLAGCDWPEPPLSAPNADRDPRLLGSWHDSTRKMSLRIEPVEEKKYRVTLEVEKNGARFKMIFVGYHTDIAGLKIVSLKMQREPFFPKEGLDWQLMGYEFSENGTLRPLFIAPEVFPPVPRPEDRRSVTGRDLYRSIAVAAEDKRVRRRIFTAPEEKPVFTRDPAPAR